jgi:hypothetical protein
MPFGFCTAKVQTFFVICKSFLSFVTLVITLSVYVVMSCRALCEVVIYYYVTCCHGCNF